MFEVNIHLKIGGNNVSFHTNIIINKLFYQNIYIFLEIDPGNRERQYKLCFMHHGSWIIKQLFATYKIYLI